MCRWPISHMVILMVITHTSLLFQVIYFTSDVSFLEFTYIPPLYWIIKDAGIILIFSTYYLDIIYKIILWYQNYCAPEEFCHFQSLWLRCLWYVSSMNTFIIFILFSLPFRLGGNVVLILIIFTLHTSFLPCTLVIVSHYPLSMSIKNHV